MCRWSKGTFEKCHLSIKCVALRFKFCSIEYKIHINGNIYFTTSIVFSAKSGSPFSVTPCTTILNLPGISDV